jgi:hypothetical protein
LKKKQNILRLAAAALVILSAALCAIGQAKTNAKRAPRASGKTASTSTAAATKRNANTTVKADPPAAPAPAKKNTRETEANAPAVKTPDAPKKDAKDSMKSASANVEAVRYVYEFKQPQSSVMRILIEHDATGRGHITFERRVDTEPITDPIELSPAALERINALWDALHFLDTDAGYQAVKQFPHLGTTRLQLSRGARRRSTEFNWTEDDNAAELAKEYHRAAEQAMLVFEINISLENQPLELPKLLIRFERLIEVNGLSDPRQLVPFLRGLETDERVPLIARNHALRLLKKLEK